MVRFPGAWRALAALGQRLLEPRSRLRRALLQREVVSGWAAVSRQDFELMLVRYAPDGEIEFDPYFEALGLGGTFRGHDRHLQLIRAFGEAWDGFEVRPEIVLDLGERGVVLGRFRLPGTASGLELEHEFAQLLTVRGGVVTREQWFSPWEKGLRAAGLDPDALALPSSGRTGRLSSSPR